MEAIKKKMQALKIEKDNALDRAEAAENQLRDSNLRVEKVPSCFNRDGLALRLDSSDLWIF